MKYYITVIFVCFILSVKLLIECNKIPSGMSKDNNPFPGLKGNSVGKSFESGNKKSNSNMNNLINSTLLDELKSSKFYVRGHTNIGKNYGCTMQSRWGPAKDVSYFLYDQQPYDQDRDSRKRRMKRKHDMKDDDEDEEEDREENDDMSNDDDCEEDESSEAKLSASSNKRAASSKYNKKEKHRLKRKHHEWQTWGPWGTCSASCGKGVRSRWRHCMSPTCQKGEKQADVKECISAPCKK